MYGMSEFKKIYVITDKHFDQAIDFYTQAIDMNPNVAAYYGNRAFAYIKTECFGYALEDANKALQLDKKFLKVRKGSQAHLFVVV